jgi:hypothetical protein
MTTIDQAHFLDAYLKHAGKPYVRDVPQTLEAFFDSLHSPTEFSASTASSLYAASAAVNRADVTLSEDPLISDVTVFPGNVWAPNFTFNSHVLVLGDLDVDRVITADPEHAILMVAGSVRCQAMQLVRGYLFVTGDVIARDCFLGCAYGFSKVGGRVATSIYLHDCSWANRPVDSRLNEDATTGNIAAKMLVDIDAPDVWSTLRPLLLPSACQTDGTGGSASKTDIFEIFDVIARGEPVLRRP